MESVCQFRQSIAILYASCCLRFREDITILHSPSCLGFREIISPHTFTVKMLSAARKFSLFAVNTCAEFQNTPSDFGCVLVCG